MQVIGLPRQITQGARLASRLCAAERSEGAHRRDAIERWKQAREDGLNARSAAAAVGVPLSTLYRWRKRAERGRLEPLSRRPRRVRRAQWAPALVAAVREARNDYPMWGKAKIAILIQRQGFDASESTVGRILKTLVEKGHVFPVPALRRNAPRAARRKRPWATRLPKGRKPSQPGEIVQLDTLSITRTAGRPTIKQFTAYDPVTRWTCAQAWRRATAHNAKRFLDKLQEDMPFPIRAIQVDGGAEFKADFERECQSRGIDLFELPPRSPKLNGSVERNNGAWRYEFYATWDLPDNDLNRINRWVDAFADEFNNFRPHQALDNRTPAQYLQSPTANETPTDRPTSHMS